MFSFKMAYIRIFSRRTPAKVRSNLTEDNLILPFLPVDLNIKYSVELDKDKDRGLRRMFFWDDVNKQRVFTLEKNFTLSSPKTNYEMEPRTVYLMVWQCLSFGNFKRHTNSETASSSSSSSSTQFGIWIPRIRAWYLNLH